MMVQGVFFKRRKFDSRGILDDPLDFIVLVVGALVIFSVLWLILDQGKTAASDASKELVIRTNHMEHEIVLWRSMAQQGELKRPFNRLDGDLKVIANTGVLPGEDPLSVPKNGLGGKS